MNKIESVRGNCGLRVSKNRRAMAVAVRQRRIKDDAGGECQIGIVFLFQWISMILLSIYLSILPLMLSVNCSVIHNVTTSYQVTLRVLFFDSKKIETRQRLYYVLFIPLWFE